MLKKTQHLQASNTQIFKLEETAIQSPAISVFPTWGQDMNEQGI